MSKYQVFMIDPPWQQFKGNCRKVRPKQDKMLDYRVMPANDIYTLLKDRIFNLAETDHCIFMWVIDKYLTDCEQFMMGNGYKRHCRFIWDKTNGIAPAFTVRFSHEYLIWFYKGKFLPVALSARGIYRTVFIEKARQHSRKPDSAYAMLEAFYPERKKIDVFSREQRCGWAQFGDQPDYFN